MCTRDYNNLGCTSLEVMFITARKKPGPHPENPLDTEIKLRIDKNIIEQIEYCKKELNTTRSDVLRKGVQRLYDDLQKK